MGGGGGRGHFSPAAMYYIATWCFALKGLRTTIVMWFAACYMIMLCNKQQELCCHVLVRHTLQPATIALIWCSDKRQCNAVCFLVAKNYQGKLCGQYLPCSHLLSGSVGVVSMVIGEEDTDSSVVFNFVCEAFGLFDTNLAVVSRSVVLAVVLCETFGSVLVWVGDIWVVTICVLHSLFTVLPETPRVMNITASTWQWSAL